MCVRCVLSRSGAARYVSQTVFDLRLKLRGIFLGGVEPIPALMWLQRGLAQVAVDLDGEIDATMPRWITSSVSSWAVQWVIGRPDFSGGSQATAKIWVTCSGVNLPGAPGRGSSPRTASMARRKTARDSQHSMSMSRFHALAQRRRQRPTWRCVRPTRSAISSLSRPSKARTMIAARCRSREGAVTEREKVEGFPAAAR